MADHQAQAGAEATSASAPAAPAEKVLYEHKQAAFYIMRDAEHRARQAASLGGYTPYGDDLAAFEEAVAARMYEIGRALDEGRLTITPPRGAN